MVVPIALGGSGKTAEEEQNEQIQEVSLVYLFSFSTIPCTSQCSFDYLSSGRVTLSPFLFHMQKGLPVERMTKLPQINYRV